MLRVKSLLLSPRFWAGLLAVTGSATIIVMVEPVRIALHTTLSSLRETPIELKSRQSYVTQPTSPTGVLSAGIFVVREMQPARSVESPGTDVLDTFPFEVQTINPPPNFATPPHQQAWIGGRLRVAVDFQRLGQFLEQSDLRLPLPLELQTADIDIRDGAALITTWESGTGKMMPLVLMQLKPPRISGPPEMDMELFVEVLIHEFLPPIVSRQIRVADTPLIRSALGRIDSREQEKPRAFSLIEGTSAVTWHADGVMLVLTGRLDRNTLLELAATARSV